MRLNALLLHVLAIVIAALFALSPACAAFPITPRSETAARPSPLPEKHKRDRSFRNGFVAYFAAGLGVVGLLIASSATVPFMLILGLAAGVFGEVGLKHYRHDRFFRALCYVGLVLGAILVLYASVPILFAI